MLIASAYFFLVIYFSEVEKIATHVGILSRGKLLFQGSIDSLQNIYKKRIQINTNDGSSGVQILNNSGYTATLKNCLIELPFVSWEEIAKANAILVQNGLKVYTMEMAKKDLEEYFLEVTKN